MPDTVALDRTDLRLLALLQSEGRLPNSELATRVNLSPSACLRRVRLLEQSGVIRGYAAIVSHAAPHEGTTAIVQIELERQTEEYLVRFEKAVRDHAEIQEWYLMSGSGDYVLRVQIDGIDAYGAFHRDVLSRLPGVSRIMSSFAMRSNRRM